MSRIGSTGRVAEKRTTKRLGGQLRPASGAMEGAKGDFKTEQFLVECKSTERDSIALKHEWLGKIAHEARGAGRSPALSITFVDHRGAPVRDGSWVAIPEWLFKELTDAV